MRTDRYRDLLPTEKLAATSCTIVGVGAIGRQVGLQLSAMGVAEVQLIDFDTVEEVNLGPQAYLADDVGRTKVSATADLMQQLNPMLGVYTVPERFAKSTVVHPVVFCCVDSIDTRRHIWQSVRDRASLFVDGRMAAEVMRIITVSGSQGRDRYPGTLFAAGEAHRERCTARSTIYCANIAAGLMVTQFAKWLRGVEPDFEVSLNLLACELAVS